MNLSLPTLKWNVIGGCWVFLLLLSGKGMGQPPSSPDSQYPTVNSGITAIAQDETYTYIGGNFSTVTDNSGASPSTVSLSRLFRFDTGTGEVDTTWKPRPAGTVNAIAIKGADIYIGGSFTSVAGVARTRLAKLNNTDGEMDGVWLPSCNASIFDLAIDGTDIYVAGQFSVIGGKAVKSFAKLNTVNGDADADWSLNPDIRNGFVIEVDGSDVYVGGIFTSIGGQSCSNLAKVDKANATVSSTWLPDPNGAVFAVNVSSTDIYVGGSFTSIGGESRSKVARLDQDSGVADTDWDPSADDLVSAILTDGAKVYLGGSFTTIGGVNRNRIALVDDIHGDVYGWNPNADGVVSNMIASGQHLIIGGLFATLGGSDQGRLAVFIDTTPIWDGAAWSPAAPTESDNAIINGNYDANTDGDLICTGLTINREMLFTMSEGASVRIAGDFRNDGTASLSGGTIHLDGATTQTITGHTTFYDLEIDNASGVSIGARTDIVINRQLVLTDGVLATAAGQTLTLGATADATAEVSVSAGHVSGDFVTVQQYIDGSYDGSAYRHISSPVSGVTFGDLSGPGFVLDLAEGATFNADPQDPGLNSDNFPNLFIYQTDEATTGFAEGWKCPIPTTLIPQGTGFSTYIQASSHHDDTTLQLTGELHTGDIAVPITNPDVDHPAMGWSLIGNPYASPLSIRTLLATNADATDGAVYVLESASPSGSTYAAQTLGGVTVGSLSTHIAPMQGFFVRGTASSGTVNFTDAMRSSTYQNPSFLRTEEGEDEEYQGIIRIAVSPQDAPAKASETVLVLHPEASSGKDYGHEAQLLVYSPEGYPTILYRQAENGMETDLVVKAIEAATTKEQVLSEPLLISTDQAGEYTLEAKEILRLTSGAKVILEDKTTGVDHDLTAAPYTFTIESGWHPDRFVVHIQDSYHDATGLEELSHQGISIRTTEHSLQVTFQDQLSARSSIVVLDMSGRELAKVDNRVGESHLTIFVGQAPMVIIKIINAQGTYTSKIRMAN